jgi:hypothetical protein
VNKSHQSRWRSLVGLGLKHAAILSGMLFCGQAAHAAVIFVQPLKRIALNSGNPATLDYNIDLNGDGIFDLQHDSSGSSSYLRTWNGTRLLGLRQPYQNVSWYESLPYPLTSGVSIDEDSPALFPQYGALSGWQSHPVGVPGAASLHVRYNIGSSGSFLGIRGYLGIEFFIAGQIHYGWMDLDNYQWNQTEIRGWAYETEPGKAILAGAIPEPSALLFACVTLGSCLFVRRRRVAPNPFNIP